MLTQSPLVQANHNHYRKIEKGGKGPSVQRTDEWTSKVTTTLILCQPTFYPRGSWFDLQVNVRRRPGLDRFMRQVAEKFEVIVFTASQVCPALFPHLAYIT
eukprot:9489750-Pyramimonas_sp.AAC.2